MFTVVADYVSWAEMEVDSLLHRHRQISQTEPLDVAPRRASNVGVHVNLEDKAICCRTIRNEKISGPISTTSYIIT